MPFSYTIQNFSLNLHILANQDIPYTNCTEPLHLCIFDFDASHCSRFTLYTCGIKVGNIHLSSREIWAACGKWEKHNAQCNHPWKSVWSSLMYNVCYFAHQPSTPTPTTPKKNTRSYLQDRFIAFSFTSQQEYILILSEVAILHEIVQLITQLSAFGVGAHFLIKKYSEPARHGYGVISLLNFISGKWFVAKILIPTCPIRLRLRGPWCVQ